MTDDSGKAPLTAGGLTRTCAPRGRPRVQERADEIVAGVLAGAGPRASTPAYSTRGVAELTGLSQSVAARAFRRIRSGAPDAADPAGGLDPAERPEAGEAPEAGLRLSRMRVEYPVITIGFRPVGQHAEAPSSARPQVAAPARHAAAAPTGPLEPRRPTPLAASRRAAAVMAALWVSDAGAWHSPDPHPHLAEETSAEHPDELILTWAPGTGRWEDFLLQTASLLDRCRSRDAIPGQLLQLMAARAGRGLHGIAWSSEEEPTAAAAGAGAGAGAGENGDVSDSESLAVSEFPAPGRSGRSRWIPDDQLSVTEQIAVTLRKEIMESGAATGDRVGARALADRLGLKVGTVRSAMRRLADDGLLNRTDRGFAVPWVTGADVIDLYAARLQTGAVLLRGCAAQPRHRLLAARLALGAVEAAAAQGTRSDVGQADLQFQQVLAEAAGLAQSARSFHALTLRVRMFISVLQLDYSPAVDRIVSDDRRILAALLGKKPEEAVRLWRGKLDNAVRHMSALAPESFDAQLWNRLVPH